jgi:hypothetical protein
VTGSDYAPDPGSRSVFTPSETEDVISVSGGVIGRYSMPVFVLCLLTGTPLPWMLFRGGEGAMHWGATNLLGRKTGIYRVTDDDRVRAAFRMNPEAAGRKLAACEATLGDALTNFARWCAAAASAYAKGPTPRTP